MPRPLLGLVDALCDPRRRGRAILLLTAGYAALWTLYGVVAKSSQDLNSDMGEMVVWSRLPDWGYPRHPPFLAWMVGLWFRIFPTEDWAFLVLSACNLALGLWLAFVLAGEWLDGAKRAAVPFLLAMIPFYNFLGLKFDQNSALITLWALTMLAFVRSLDTGSAGWAALAGLAGAASMLSKYWSAFLLLALAIVALSDHRRRDYFRSPAPYVTIGIAAILVAPHLVWLVQNNFETLNWAGSRHAAGMADWLSGAVEYCFGGLGYAGFAILAVGLAIWPRLDPRQLLFSSRRLALMFWLPLLVPIAFAAATQTVLLSLWTTPSMTLLPILLLSSPAVAITREAAARIAGFAIAASFVALAASPLVGYVILNRGVENNLAYARLLMTEMQNRWRQRTDKPLALVGGPFGLISSAAFYGVDRPVTFVTHPPGIAPWGTQERIARHGMAMVCPVDDRRCLDVMKKQVALDPAAASTEVTLRRRWLMFEGPQARFAIAILP